MEGKLEKVASLLRTHAYRTFF
uniref:Uncharacterized protein n=1 Tax=Arundo donax TaxID=35708 RepID=A0A0A8ZCC3_ARUDO